MIRKNDSHQCSLCAVPFLRQMFTNVSFNTTNELPTVIITKLTIWKDETIGTAKYSHYPSIGPTLCRTLNINRRIVTSNQRRKSVCHFYDIGSTSYRCGSASWVVFMSSSLIFMFIERVHIHYH